MAPVSRYPIREGSGATVSRQPARGAGTRKAQKKPGLSFITITDLSQVKSTARKKAVRSHVAHVQHYKEWKEQQEEEEDIEVIERQPTRSLSTETGVEQIPRSDFWGPERSASPWCVCNRYTNDDSCKGSCNRDAAWMWMVENYSSIMMEGILLTGRILSGGIRVDPFRSAPDQGEHVPRITDHYLQHMAVSVPEIDLGQKNALREVWFPFAMAEPSVFQTVMLLSSSNYAHVTKDMSKVPNLLLLRQRALQYINEGLSHPKRRHSDELIVAVAKIACYEAMYGTYAAYCIHMEGLVRILEEKGGIQNLGLGGLLMRMCLWIDNNSGILWNNPKRFFHQSLTFDNRSAIRPR